MIIAYVLERIVESKWNAIRFMRFIYFLENL